MIAWAELVLHNLSVAAVGTIAYLFNDNLEAARAVFILYFLTLLTRIWHTTKKYQREQLRVMPCYRSTLLAVLNFKAWQPGYLEMAKLEDKMLGRWTFYLLLPLVAQQIKLLHSTLAELVPVGAVFAIGYWEIRCIVHAFEVGGNEQAGEFRAHMDDCFREAVKGLIRKALAFLSGQVGMYQSQQPMQQQRPPPNKPLGQPPKDNNREV